MKILTADWQPTEENIRILKLNELPDDHIEKAIEFFKTKFINTSIDDVENYDNWNALFIMFAIKAYRQMNPDAPVPTLDP